MNSQKNENIYFKLSSNGENWMESFRLNIGILRNYYGWSVRVLAEKANISESTLNKIIQGITKDCDQSLVIKLAKAFNVSVDELIGAETINPVTKESLAICRSLPNHFLYLVRSYIRHVYKLFIKSEPNEFPILVMLPECKRGHLKTTNVTNTIDISNLPKSTRSRIAHGLKIPCEHYEPYFMPEETILLAVDRDGLDGEMCVISFDGNYYIVRKKMYISNGQKKWKYMSLFTEKEFLKEEIEDKLGYVVGFLFPDGTWGER